MSALDPAALRRTLDPSELPFDSTADAAPLDGMISQPRAGEALDLALAVDAPGYNLFATGRAGTGRRSTLDAELRRRAAQRAPAPDRVYVHDFAAPTRPKAIPVATGAGPDLARDVAALVEDARAAIGAAFESDGYRERRRRVREGLDARRREIIDGLQTEARAHDVALELTPAGVVSMPLVDGRPVTPDAFTALPEERQTAYQHAVAQLEEAVAEAFGRLRRIEREGRDAQQKLDREVALFAVGHLVDEVKARWRGVEAIGPWLDALVEDLISHLDLLRSAQAEPPSDDGPALTAAGPVQPVAAFLTRYEVNVLVTHDPSGGAPVVTTHDCSYYDLFGRIEYDSVYGAAVTDHRHIRAGAVHKADGGYLLLEAADVLAKPFVWGRLKEVLRTGRARLENLGAQYMLFPFASLDPEPIDIDLTVVLVGSNELYRLLFELDDDVRRLFKVRADFDSETEWDADAIRSYAAFAGQQVRELGLPHLDRGALARVVEHGARLAEDRERLSTRLPEISDLVAEAGHLARRDGAGLTSVEHVERALHARRHRSNLPEQRLREAMRHGTLRIEVTGEALGQVNGLAVVQLGDHRFGHPMRVTASVAPGDGTVLDIDREAELSGPIHDKGFLILSGLLRRLYCRDTPLALHASIVFEQSYGGVEGDSASGAELLALLSELAGVPLHQRIGVTGSVDQHGRLQAIGGVNEKIEGFFALCRERGLTGDQGVIIPATNTRHLMLDGEVVEAVRDGAFHVWTAATVDEAIELLTGIPPGVADADGNYPDETFHGRAQARVASLADLAREMRRPAGEPLP